MAGNPVSDRFVTIAFEHLSKVGLNRTAPQVLLRVVVKSACGQLGVRLYDSRDKLSDDIAAGLDVIDISYYELKGVG